MRLIDADKIIKILKELQEHSLDGKINIGNMLYLVEIQNTAYDIDKVVEELKKATYYDETGVHTVVGSGRSIEIVKAGGKNE